jgi:hypothetical protein
MKSSNFEFLLERWSELASLDGFAESYSPMLERSSDADDTTITITGLTHPWAG